MHAFCHALPQTWHQMAVILSAAGEPRLVGGRDRQAGGGADRGARRHAGRAGAALFLPYLAGERTPHNDVAIRGAFLGLDAGMDRRTLTQAVLEGVAFTIRDGLDALAEAGTTLSAALVTGGGSRSRAWLAILASVLDLTLSRPAAGEHGAALGAARLGRMAATGEDAATVCAAPAIAETIAPDAARATAYAERYARFRAAYPALKGLAV